MKKIIAMITAAVFAIGCLTACGSAQSAPEAGGSSGGEAQANAADVSGDGISIVTTIFPEYDWVREVIGDNPANADVTMLLDKGVDMHSFQPSAQDIMKIANCDLFIYVGGESDEWVEDALKESVNPDMVVINLLDALGENAKEEEIVEGMEAEEEHEEGEHSEDGHEEEGPEYDEHVWLSLKNADTLVNVIADAIETVDPENADTYAANAAAYTEQIKALDASYAEAVANAGTKTVLFGDRFPFRYMTDDYGLSYYAAFAGCSAETEASFETVIFLAGKVDEENLSSILTIEGSDQKIAQTINDNTGSKDHQILIMNSMQSTTSQDVEAGATYLSIMNENLEVLKQALQ